MTDHVLATLADYPDRLVLVIDDLHELGSAEAQAHFARLLAELPEHVHAVLGMRRDMQLRLHQLRLAGELVEIRAADLRFTEAETRALLATSGVVLSSEAAATLHRRTEGWAAGLRLAAIALAERPDPERFVAEFSGSSRTVADYLIAETLDRQPPEVQRSLLRTSPLDRVNGELADILTGSSGSERVLLELEDANALPGRPRSASCSRGASTRCPTSDSPASLCRRCASPKRRFRTPQQDCAGATGVTG
jgi:LuxR family maltose regulon positive regulatory protein